MKVMTLATLATGNELLNGSTLDRNANFLASKIRPMGISLQESRLVPDNLNQLSRALVELSQKNQLVIVSGGLGPTRDDLTVEAVCHALGRDRVFSRQAYKNLQDRLKKLKRLQMSESQKQQCYIPKGAKILANPWGTAPAMWITAGKSNLVLLPGVPTEYRNLISTHVLPWIEKRVPKLGRRFAIERGMFGVPESQLNEYFKTIQMFPEIEVEFRTRFPEVFIRLMVGEKDPSQAKKSSIGIWRGLRKNWPGQLMNARDANFSQNVFRYFKSKKVRVSLAESCTGGLAAHLISQNPGASDVLDRAWVTYQEESKTQLLGVPAKTIKNCGVVSREVAEAMARGALKKSSADVALSVTGVAGPGGGSKEFPIGLIWIGGAIRRRGQIEVVTKKLQLGSERSFNQILAANFLLLMGKQLLRGQSQLGSLD